MEIAPNKKSLAFLIVLIVCAVMVTYRFVSDDVAGGTSEWDAGTNPRGRNNVELMLYILHVSLHVVR